MILRVHALEKVSYIGWLLAGPVSLHAGGATSMRLWLKGETRTLDVISLTNEHMAHLEYCEAPCSSVSGMLASLRRLGLLHGGPPADSDPQEKRRCTRI
jgi:hypothetical protein